MTHQSGRYEVSDQKNSEHEHETISLDEVLMLLNDHVDESARAELRWGSEGRIAIWGILEHWSSDEESLETAKRATAIIAERVPDFSLSEAMERSRAVYWIGNAKLDLWALSEGWLLIREPVGGLPHACAIQTRLAEGVALRIVVGVDISDIEAS
jgi:hypothetical protein